jgi:hypothetical protein
MSECVSVVTDDVTMLSSGTVAQFLKSVCAFFVCFSNLRNLMGSFLDACFDVDFFSFRRGQFDDEIWNF